MTLVQKKRYCKQKGLSMSVRGQEKTKGYTMTFPRRGGTRVTKAFGKKRGTSATPAERSSWKRGGKAKKNCRGLEAGVVQFCRRNFQIKSV